MSDDNPLPTGRDWPAEVREIADRLSPPNDWILRHAATVLENLRALASDAIAGCEQRCDDRGGCPYPFAEDCGCDKLKERLLEFERPL